jgi:hypothetical protein
MVKSQAENFATLLHQAAAVLSDAIATRNSKYYFFIKAGLIASKASIPLTCMCGETRTWVPPHATTDLYCTSCGSSFQLLEVDGDGGYIITSNGPVKVIGANVPDFRDLPLAEQMKLLKQCEEAAKQAHAPQPGSQPDATQ